MSRYWSPVREALPDELALLPVHPRRAPARPAPAAGEQIVVEAVSEPEPGEKWRSQMEAM